MMRRLLMCAALAFGGCGVEEGIDSDLATTEVTAQVAHFDTAPNEIVVRLSRTDDDACLRLAQGTTVTANGVAGTMLSRGGQNQACMEPTFGVQLVPMPDSVDLSIEDGSGEVHLRLLAVGDGRFAIDECDAGACEILQKP